MRHEHLLCAERAILILIDLQEAFKPVIPDWDRLVSRARILVEGARLLGVPVLCTEQYPKGLGATVAPMLEVLHDTPRMEKTEFSALQNEAVARAVRESGRTQLLLAGVESHVCVAQTAFDALALKFQPFLAADAAGSRRAVDYDIALARMRHATVQVTTVEAALLEMTVNARHPQFRAVSKLIR